MIKNLFSIVLVAVLFASCATSDVANNGFLQKRKYNKGWYAHKKSKDLSKKSNQDIIALNDKSDENIQKEELTKKAEVKSVSIENISSDRVSNYPSSSNNISKENNLLVAKEKSTSVAVSSNITNQRLVEESISEIQARPIQEVSKTMTNGSHSSGYDPILLYVLAFFLPPIAVGLATNWETTPVISNLLWCLLCGLPGIIHAIIKIGEYR